MRSTIRLFVAAVVAGSAATTYVLACGPWLLEYRAVQIISPAHPDEYSRGSVGVVRPRFARRYLVQAYRRFSGREPLPGVATRVSAADYLNPPPTPAQQWTTLRASILKGEPVHSDLAHRVDIHRRVDGAYQSIRNCLDDAFTSAIRTAASRTSTFGGAESPQVREWVRAQDAVFTNCAGGPLVLPEPAPATADPLTRADRAYQTAAAYFYGMQYDEAAQRFRAIAADATSPWRVYGRYLAARAMIRSGTTPDKYVMEPLTAAQGELRRVLEDPAAASLHGSARGLLDFVDAHVRPIEHLRVISSALAGGRAASPQQLIDYQWLMDRLLGDTTTYQYDAVDARDAIVASSDMNDWMLAMQGSGNAALDRAIAQWTRGRGVPWLIAALWKLPPDHRDAPALLQAAAGIDRSSPAFPTLAFLRARLLSRRGDAAEARALLATLPSSPQPGFEPETLNLLAAERLMLAATLDEALRNAPRAIVGEYTDRDMLQLPPRASVPVFDADAEVLFSLRLPLSSLIEASASSTLPARLRQRVAGAALVRALLLKRYPEALEAAAVLHTLAPSLARDIDRFRAATTPEDMHIAALFLLLRTPGLRARVQGVEDDQLLRYREPPKTFEHLYNRNWWCSFDAKGSERRVPDAELLTLLYDGEMPSPSYLTNDERSALDGELGALAKLGTAPTYLAREAVKWAVARPADPNAAEALARAVEGTRWGCADTTTRAASRAAFQTLHKLFPKTEWAKRTKSLVLAAAVLGAALVDIPEHPRGYICYRAPSSVKIDGALDDAAWRDAPWTDDFVDIEGSRKPAPALRTRVKMLWDDTYFYIGANLAEPNLWATMKEHDSVLFHENDFEFFIDPNGDSHEYYEFEINALGTGWDLLLPRPYKDGGKAVNNWEIRGLQSAIHLDGTLNAPGDTDRGWSVELAVPWAALGELARRRSPPGDGDRWRVNFSRVEWPLSVVDGAYRPIKGQREHNWVWSPQHVVDMHRPETWGYVQFSSGKPGTASFTPDPSQPARRWLHEVYYAQREFRKANGRWAGTLAELGTSSGIAGLSAPAMATAGSLFEASVGLRLPDGRTQRWHIRQDALIWPGE